MILRKAQLAIVESAVLAHEMRVRLSEGGIGHADAVGPLRGSTMHAMTFTRLIAISRSLGRQVASYDGRSVFFTPKRKPCTACDGTGIIPGYAHVDGGVCFKCRRKR